MLGARRKRRAVVVDVQNGDVDGRIAPGRSAFIGIVVGVHVQCVIASRLSVQFAVDKQAS